MEIVDDGVSSSDKKVSDVQVGWKYVEVMML